jgi:hypothetical protein
VVSVVAPSLNASGVAICERSRVRHIYYKPRTLSNLQVQICDKNETQIKKQLSCIISKTLKNFQHKPQIYNVLNVFE